MKNITNNKNTQPSLPPIVAMNLSAEQITAFSSIPCALDEKLTADGISGKDIELGTLLVLFSAVAFEDDKEKRNAIFQNICNTLYDSVDTPFDSRDEFTVNALAYLLTMLNEYSQSEQAQSPDDEILNADIIG